MSQSFAAQVSQQIHALQAGLVRATSWRSELPLAEILHVRNSKAIGAIIAANSTIKQLAGVVVDTGGQAIRWAVSRPLQALPLGLGFLAMAAPAVVSGAVLNIFGFAAGGIVPNSIAAGLQAAMGDVAAGSIFATLQSAAMSGYGAAIVNGVTVALGGTTAGGTAVKAVVEAKSGRS